ncbi:acetate/propionate family kinase [Brucella sp. 2716]|uniref:acetate/propionate family kinase n=1 Tax=Brucella sp. 2716 TaxID=2975052 RepID=UPI00217E89CD|nr:acetate/propionate family kinase [Brucella sp. 2716]UWF60861.1 acetate/propionate family kinase [Brucella sp. 2716]
MNKQLVTFNAGSSTVKIGVFECDGNAARKVSKGDIDLTGSPLRFRLRGENGNLDIVLSASGTDEITTILGELFDKLAEHIDPSRILAVGHRVVFGGDDFAQAVLIDDDNLEAIERLSIFAPLHQPKSLALIKAVRKIFPHLAQTASFDTAFHQTIPDTVRRFAIPQELHDRGIKRFGFHGLSYKSIIGNFSQRAPELAEGKIIAAHLGSGASLCAMRKRESLDTSMSFSTLDGIPMATRCGALDPGVLLHLLQQEKMEADALADLLYHRSGLLGLSDLSGDTRDLLESDVPQARAALDIFALRIAGEICRLASTLNGLDAVIFTAGIGEHQPAIRAAICQRLAWQGVELDPAANDENAFCITSRTSRTAAFVLPTDEEQIIASETFEIIRQMPATARSAFA